MAFAWDKPATKYSQGRSRAPSTITANWASLPWKDLYTECKELQEEAVGMAAEDNLTRYNSYIRSKEEEILAVNPEWGSVEENLGERYPFQELPAPKLFKIRRAAAATAIEDFIIRYSIKSFGVSLLQQLTKNISEYKLSDIDGDAYDPVKAAQGLVDGYDNHLISAERLCKHVFGDDTMKGIYNFLMMDTRSSILDKQYASPSRSYCALVPLIMHAFKYHHGVPYTHWERSETRLVTNVKLADAMLWDEELPSKDDIMQARSEGLLIKSGPKTGDVRNPTYTFKLYGKSVLSDYPEYVQVMAAQIWCAHPQNRTKYMILDHLNWDSVPAPLIATESIISTVSKSSKSPDKDYPWL